MQFNRMLALPGAFLMLASTAPLVRADATADATKAITAAYAKVNAAAAKKDAAGILAMHASDYYETDPKGQKHTIAEMKAQLPTVFKMARSIKSHTTVDKVTLKGKTAVALIRDHSEIVVTNPQSPSGASKLVVDSKSEDTWMKTEQGWKEKSSKSISSEQTLDGKKMPAP